jgi:tRNA(Ile)-lysidine synthase
VDARLAVVEAAVRRAVAASHLWPARAIVVAAVSGGADSLCLLGVLEELRSKGEPAAPGEIVVAHLDHGLRGDMGAADAALVAELAAQLGLRSVVERADVPTLARRQRLSLEDAARRVRYSFLRRTAAECGAERICTGHTQDDQAETILLHLLRGSGLDGLSGMAPLNGDIARPLLAVSRAVTEAYCAARGWQPCVDTSNADVRFLRNRVRHELLPLLEQYNPQLREVLARNAELITADEAYLEAQTAAVWVTITQEVGIDGTGSHEVALLLDRLREVAPALRHRLLRRAARFACGEEYVLAARHILQLDELVAAGHSGQGHDLPAPLRVDRDYRAVVFRRADARAEMHAASNEPIELPVPGMIELPQLGWRIRAWRQDGSPGIDLSGNPPPPLLPAFAQAGDEGNLGHAMTRVHLAASAAESGLLVRTWRPGDRFRPLGMVHEKKLQDYFADAKVPRDLRSRLPLVFGPDHLLWVAGLRIDDRAKLEPGTTSAIILQLERTDTSQQESSE